MEKLKIDRPIIVEGKYDKITLSSVLDAEIIPTHGFSLFKNDEKVALLRRLAGDGGVILLTDADGGGKQIRARLCLLSLLLIQTLVNNKSLLLENNFKATRPQSCSSSIEVLSSITPLSSAVNNLILVISEIN